MPCSLSWANFRAVFPLLVTAWMLACTPGQTRPSAEHHAHASQARSCTAHECTLAARSSRRQPTRPFCAEYIKAVTPSLLTASTLACTLRHDRPSTAQPPYRIPPDTAPASNTHTHTHTLEIARILRGTDECTQCSLALSFALRTSAPWQQGARGGSRRGLLPPTISRPCSRFCQPPPRWPAHLDMKDRLRFYHPTTCSSMPRLRPTHAHTHAQDSPHLDCNR